MDEMLKIKVKICYRLTSFLFIAFTLLGCGKPLTEKEEQYFIKLEKECKCIVTREYNKDATPDFKHGPGWYKLILTYDYSMNSDSLELMSMKAAYELHHSILTDVKYPYNEIKVIHILDKGGQSVPIKSYTYHYSNHHRIIPHLYPNE